MPAELRGEFHRDLDNLDIALGALITLVPDVVTNVTAALASPDRVAAHEVVHWRSLIGDLYDEVEATAERIVARQAPVAGDLRFLLTCVRLVPIVADAVDLVADLASPAMGMLEGQLSGRVAVLTRDIGGAAASAWTAVGDLWDRRDVVRAQAVRDRDDALADVHSALAAELATGSLDLPVALQMAIVGRSYERLGRAATTAGRLIEPLIRRTVA